MPQLENQLSQSAFIPRKHDSYSSLPAGNTSNQSSKWNIAIDSEELEPVKNHYVILTIQSRLYETYQSPTFMVMGTACAEALLQAPLGLWP